MCEQGVNSSKISCYSEREKFSMPIFCIKFLPPPINFAKFMLRTQVKRT